MPSTSFTLFLRVPLYDLDLRDEVPCATLFHYLEETAIQASAHAGFSLAWYRERNQFWVLRTMRFERAAAVRYQDELEIRTWVSAMTRVRADRNYLVRRVSDGRVLARALANWVYLDSRTFFPTRIAPQIATQFQDTEPPALSTRTWHRPYLDPEEKLRGATTRRAQYFEADSARHTNNAIYVNWFEEAVRNTLLAQGYALPLEDGPTLWFYRHSLEYLTSARPGDNLEITTQLRGRGHSTGYWEQTIRRMPDGEIVARGECITVWRDAQNCIIAWLQPSA